MKKIPLDDITIAFLRHLWRGGEAAYWWYLDREKTYLDKNGVERERKRTVWFSPSKIPAFVAPEATEHTYFGVHPDSQAREYRRSTGKSVSAINCLFADFDGGTPLETIESIDPVPSAIVETSPGKYHCYWLLDQPFMITDEDSRQRAKDIQSDWTDWLLSHGTSVAADRQARDLARVLRVPGTSNVKASYAPSYPIATWVRCTMDQTYSFEELQERCSVVRAMRTAKNQQYTGSLLDGRASIIDAFNEQVSIESALACYGYRHKSGNRWIRPGGESGTVYTDNNRSFHHNTNDECAGGYWQTPFSLFCHYEHDDDVSRAVKAAAASMTMSSPSHQHRRTNAAAPIAPSTASPSPSTAPPFLSMPLIDPSVSADRLARRMAENDALLNSPSVFPVDVLPPAIRNMVITTARSSETDPAMAGMAALGIMSAMVTRATTTVYASSWEESTVLSVMIFAPSGERKSAVMNPLLRPMIRRQREMYQSYDDERKAWKKRQRTPQDEDEHEPKRKLLYLSDVTPARLVRVMADNESRASAISDEARTFMSTVMGHRHTTDGGDELALFCSGWDGRDYIFERVGQGSIVLREPRLTLCLMMQNDVLSKMSQNQALRESGFLARCLVAMPPSRIGYRTHDAPPPRPDIVQAYEAVCERVMNLGPIQARLAYDALDRIRIFHREKEHLQRPGEIYEGVADWLQKASSHIIRIATLFAIFDGFPESPELLITVDHVERAIHIIEYCLHQWLRVDGSVMGENRMQQDAMAVLRWMNRTGRHVGDTMPIREIVAAVRCIKNTRYAEDVCAYLVESGRLQQLERQPGQRSWYYRILSLDMGISPPKDPPPSPSDEFSSMYHDVIVEESEMTERVLRAHRHGTLVLSDYGGRVTIEDEHGIILEDSDERRLRGWCSSLGITFADAPTPNDAHPLPNDLAPPAPTPSADQSQHNDLAPPAPTPSVDQSQHNALATIVPPKYHRYRRTGQLDILATNQAVRQAIQNLGYHPFEMSVMDAAVLLVQAEADIDPGGRS